jgi:hypothetical protein
LNYCHGKRSSSSPPQEGDPTLEPPDELYLPLAPMVNYINHAPTLNQVNAKLESSMKFRNTSTSDHGHNQKHKILHYEYIATSDIYNQEEILTSYGSEWEQAWSDHVQSWSSSTSTSTSSMIGNAPAYGDYAGDAYSPAYVMDDVASILRTDKEQISHPFPENLKTSCFYRYSSHV